MFLKNKYQKLYFKIINNAKKRKNIDVYEIHHIIPRSFNILTKINYKNNLVKLSPREHFICHRLLVKFTNGIYNQKMKSALLAMTIVSKTLSSRDYNISVKDKSNLLKGHTFQNGNKNSQYGKKWIKFDELKIQMKILLLDTFNYIDQGWTYGRKMSYKNVTNKRNRIIAQQNQRKRINKLINNAKEKYQRIYKDFLKSELNFNQYCIKNNINRRNIFTYFKKYNITNTTKK